MNLSLWTIAVSIFSTGLMAESRNFAAFAVVEKHDFAIRLLEEHEEFKLGYNDREKQDLVLTTNSQFLVGGGFRVGDFKISYGVPTSISQDNDIGESTGETLKAQHFDESHFFHFQRSRIRKFYQIAPGSFDGEGLREHPSFPKMKIESTRLRYTYVFEPGNYSLRTKYLQTETESTVDGASLLFDLRLAQEKLSHGDGNFIPEETADKFPEDSTLEGFSVQQFAPHLGLGYMMREQTIYFVLDVLLGMHWQDQKIYREEDSKSSQESGISAAVEFGAGMVLANAYLAINFAIDSFQIPLNESYIELDRGYARVETGIRF